MRMWTKGTARAAMFTASFVAMGAGALSPHTALADTTSGEHSVLGGNQITAPISLPINVSGNSVAVLGDAVSSSEGGAQVVDKGSHGGGAGRRTSGVHSIGGGNQVDVPVRAPVNVCGNAVAVIGQAIADCEGGAKVKNRANGSGGGNRTSGSGSVLGGNQVNAPVSVPVNVCGNAIGNALAGCEGGAKVKSGGPGSTGGDLTSGRHSIGGGNQIKVPVKAPVNVCGNAAAVLGDSLAGCAGGASVGGGHHGHPGYDDPGYDPGYEHPGYDNGGYEHAGSGYRTAAAEAPAPLPESFKALPLSPGAALPVLPQLPSGASGFGPVDEAAATLGSFEPGDALTPPGLPIQSSQLPQLPVSPEQVTSVLPANARTIGRPADIVPGTLPLPGRGVPVPDHGIPVPAAQSRTLPVPPRDLPGSPAGAGLDSLQLDGVQDQVAPQIVSVRGLAPMAASEFAGGLSGQSAFVAMIGALLAAAAGVMTVTRRIRLGRK